MHTRAGAARPKDILAGDKGPLCFGPYVLDPVRRTLLRDSAPVSLTPRLFDTLLYLARNPGRVVEREELMTAMWGTRIIEEGNLTQMVWLRLLVGVRTAQLIRPLLSLGSRPEATPNEAWRLTGDCPPNDPLTRRGL